MSDQDASSLQDRDRRHLLHGWHHPALHRDAKIWESGQGITVTDQDGRTYIDAIAGLWNVLVGYGREELVQAAAEQMRRLPFASNHVGSSNRQAVLLAERIAALCYPSINTFFFTSGGSEANESAFKAVRFFWKAQGRPEKWKVIGLEHGYHGMTMGAMAATGSAAFPKHMFAPGTPGFSHIPSPYPFWFSESGAHGGPGATPGEQAAGLLEQAILREGPGIVGAFIAEPVQGGGGVIVPPADYFPRIREICDRHEVLFIADEVITGFGRTGRWFALEHWGVEPDIVTFAKGLTSGYQPMGGMGLSDRIAAALNGVDPADRFIHALTYSGHPVACAVALANLALIEREDLVARSAEMGASLLRRLKTLERHPHVGEARGLGLLAAVELVQQREPRRRFPKAAGMGARLQAACASRGLWSRNVGDVFCLAPPLVAGASDIDRMVDLLDEALAATAP